jgi:ATP-dependent Clp protease ATP-binding subunit ClpC
MQNIDLETKFQLAVKNVIDIAEKECRLLGENMYGTEILLLAILVQNKGIAAKLCSKFKLNQEWLRRKIKRMQKQSLLPKSPLPKKVPVYPNPNFGECLELAKELFFRFEPKAQSQDMILLAILILHDNRIINIFQSSNIDILELRNKLIKSLKYIDIDNVGPFNDSDFLHLLEPFLLEESTESELLETDTLSQDSKNSSDFEEKENSSNFEEKENSLTALSNCSTNLSFLANNGQLDPVLGRVEEIENLMQILLRRRKNNAILIGEPGVGKTAVVEGLALRISNRKVCEMLQNKKIISLDLSAVLAGTKYRGEFEERLKEIINAVKANPNIILFIDEIHTLVGAGGAEGSNDAAQLLKPALARGDFQCIGATTIEEYEKYFKKDAALARRFQIVKVPEPSINESILILSGLRKKFEKYHQLRISDDALIAAVNLSAQFITDRFLPDKAIDLIDEACSSLRAFRIPRPKEITKLADLLKIASFHKTQAIFDKNFVKASSVYDYEIELRTELNSLIALQKKGNTSSFLDLCVETKDIEVLVSNWSGVPVNKISTIEADTLLNLETTLHTRVIGQNMAVTSIAKAIRRSRVGLKNPSRPIGSFIFAGPTGVGKTELAKALAFFVFGSENAMVRLDMSEYMERFNVSKLIGSPPGYIGFSEGGILTEAVRKKPYTIVLFDEIEKAHLDVYNLLLQILEDGRLTDSQSRLVDFKNTIIILTSNLGAKKIEKIQKEYGPKLFKRTVKDDEADSVYQKMCIAVKEELKEKFRPEFLNRLDDIIIFEPLTKYDIAEIADIMISNLCKRAEEKLGLFLEVDRNVKDKLVKEGFDPTYGARPLRRAITNLFEDELANLFLVGDYSKGTILRVKLDLKDKIIFEYKGFKSIVNTTLSDIIKTNIIKDLTNPDDSENFKKIDDSDTFLSKN